MTHRAFHRQQGLSLWPLLIVLIVLAALAAAGSVSYTHLTLPTKA